MSKNLNRKYVPDDNDTKSALSTGKVSDAVLASLLLRRGVLISPTESRELVAESFSSFMHCYREFEVISSQHSKSSHKEFTTAKVINTKLSTLQLNSAIQAIKEDLEKNSEANNITEISITQHQNKISALIKYVKHKPEMNLYSQYENREALITIENNSNGEFYVEAPQNIEATNFTSLLISAVKDEDENAEPESIELTGISDPRYHWKFFDLLTSTLPGFERSDVVDVYLSKPKELNEDELNSEDKYHAYRIDKASYRGENLHDSKEFKDKIKEGFHLYNICWDCVEEGKLDSDKYRLMVKFNDPENYSGFSFIAKSFFAYKDKSEGFLKSPTPMSSSDDSKFRRLIYENARKVLRGIKSEIEKETIDELERDNEQTINSQG